MKQLLALLSWAWLFHLPKFPFLLPEFNGYVSACGFQLKLWELGAGPWEDQEWLPTKFEPLIGDPKILWRPPVHSEYHQLFVLVLDLKHYYLSLPGLPGLPVEDIEPSRLTIAQFAFILEDCQMLLHQLHYLLDKFEIIPSLLRFIFGLRLVLQP